MRALVCRQWCSFYDLKIEDVPLPQLPPRGVRIAVEAVGVGFAANLWVEGKYQIKPPLPFTPGIEVSGVVSEVAPDVSRFVPGDPVWATVDCGGMAEQVIAREFNVFHVPQGLDLTAAVSVPASYATAYGAMIWKAGLKKGERILVFGAAGGVGLAAVQIAKAVGAEVIACAGSQEKVDALIAHQADYAFNYTTEDIRRQVLSFTRGKGVQLVFDPVGGQAFKAGLRCVGEEGRILTIGFSSSDIPQIPANILLVKNLSVLGFNFGKYVGWGLNDEPDRYKDLLFSWNHALARLWEAGKIRPVVYRAFPLDRFKDAMDAVLSRKAIGKVTLKPNIKHQ